jgi:glycerol-3-phosphate dehydrogenase (NAD(P)+)
MNVTVLGAGSWGTTLAVLLHSNAHKVVLWSYEQRIADLIREKGENTDFLPEVPIPFDIEVTCDLEFAVHKPEAIIIAVPTQYIRSVMNQVKSRKLRNTLFINVAKGIENQSLMRVSEILLDVVPLLTLERIVTLSGPSFAHEVSRQMPTAVVAASISRDAARQAQDLFITPYFRVYSTDDIKGVELAGALKNVIAIGAGIADGAGFGDNTKAAIMTRATAEISRLGKLIGARPETFAGLSGIGDLIATCVSKHSRNRHVGEEIGKGRNLRDILKEMVMVAEGVPTTRSVHDFSERFHMELPISGQVHQVLFEYKDPIIATADLMTRDAKDEA